MRQRTATVNAIRGLLGEVAGVLLIMGIDHFLDMGRTATNVLGNAIATAVVGTRENAAGPEEELAEEIAEEEALPAAVAD